MTDAEGIVRRYLRRVEAFGSAAHEMLATHESAPSRVVLLNETYADLAKLSVRQDDLLRQSIRCVEEGLFRAAHVMAWAGLMDFLEEKLASDGLRRLRAIRTKWKARNVEELRENVPESQIVDVARELNLCSKSQAKALHGLLNKRNECAHPSDYYPGYNETLGYISEVIKRIDLLAARGLE